MNRRICIPAAPVGQQEPPTRAAAPAMTALRDARGSLLDYGDGPITLDANQKR